MTDAPNTQSSAPKKRKSNNTLAIVAAITAVVLIMGGLFSFFVPLFGQTIAARAMDGLGQHRLAMQLDAIHQDPTMAALSSVDPSNPESCGDLWNYADESRVPRLEAMQFKQFLTIEPVNQDYKDDFYFENHLDARMSMKDQKAWAELDLNGRLNGDKLTDLVEETGETVDDSLRGNFTINAKAEAYLNTEGGFFRVPTLDIEGGELQSSDSLNDWYKGDFNLTNLQQEGVTEILDVVMDLTETNAKDVVIDETGRTLMTNYCKLIEGVEVKAPEDVTIGRDGETVRARPVVVTATEDAEEIQAEIMPEMMEAILNDDKLVEFLKSKYPEFERLSLALEKIDRSLTTGNITQEEYEEEIQKAFDEAREDFDKEEYREQLERSSQYSTSQPFEIENRPVEYFIDLDTGYMVGTRSQAVVKPTASALRDIPSGELKDLVEDGFLITQEIYDVAYNDKVEIMDAPGSAKSIEEFQTDFEQTELYREVEGLLPEQAETVQDTNDFPTTFDDDDFELTPEEEEELEEFFREFEESQQN